MATRGYVHMSAASIEEGIRSAGKGVRLVLGTKFVSFARRMCKYGCTGKHQKRESLIISQPYGTLAAAVNSLRPCIIYKN